MITLEINHWSEHINQIIYSCLYYCDRNRIKFNLIINKNIGLSGSVLNFENKKIFLDYSDDFIFLENPDNYDFYFKRSLSLNDKQNNIYPLNFCVPLSYKPLLMLSKLKISFFFDKNSIREIIKALDCITYFNDSHEVLNINHYPNKIKDNGGRVLFQTRLWNPDNHPDLEEKERRSLQNEFRINACIIIKKYFKNASVGIANSVLANTLAPELIIDQKKSGKKHYLSILNNFDIGIADDGLKNSSGWKIGEYLLYGKAVITTPLNIVTDNFIENVNYMALSNRNSFEELPDKIAALLHQKKYLEMGEKNMEWSREFIHPENYINRILSLINLQ